MFKNIKDLIQDIYFFLKKKYNTICFHFLKLKYESFNFNRIVRFKICIIILSSFFSLYIVNLRASNNQVVAFILGSIIGLFLTASFASLIFSIIGYLYRKTLSQHCSLTYIELLIWLLISYLIYFLLPYIPCLSFLQTNAIVSKIITTISSIHLMSIIILGVVVIILILTFIVSDTYKTNDSSEVQEDKFKEISNFKSKVYLFFLNPKYCPSRDCIILVLGSLFSFVCFGYINMRYIGVLLIILMIIYFFIKSIFIKRVKKSFSINYYNSFNDSDFSKRNVFINAKHDTANLKTFVLNIDKRVLVTDEYDIKLLSINNFYRIGDDDIKMIDNKILISINSNNFNNKEIVSLQLYASVFKNDGIISSLKINLQVLFEKHDDLIVPVSLIVLNVIKIKDRFSTVSLYNLEKEESVRISSKIIPNLLCMQTLKPDETNFTTTSTAKFSSQDGIFGNGKTTFSIINIINRKHIPIIVSVWEDNTSNDLLYSIYQKLKNTRNKKFFPKLAKKTRVIFWAGYIVVLNLLISACGLFKEGSVLNFNLIDFSSSLNIEVLLVNSQVFNWFLNALIFIFIFYLIGLLLQKTIYPFLCGDVIIYKNNFDTYYREQLIDEICSMLSKDYPYMLLIEDIDRLEVEEINKVFRDISFINRKMNNSSKIRGIVSFDNKLLHKMFINYESKNNLVTFDSNNGESKILNDILNKIIFGQIFKIDNKEMLSRYKSKSILYVEALYDKSIIEQTHLENFKNSNDFREAKNILILLINDCNYKITTKKEN